MERRVPLVVPSATGNKVNELFAEAPANYVFHLAASDAVQSSMMVTEAFAARGRTRAAILADDSPYGAQGRARVEALIAGPFGDGAITPQTFVEAGASEPAQERFVAAYRKRHGVAHVTMAPAAAQAYDAVHLLALAIAQARSTDAAKVKAALENLEATYEGATGSYFAPWRPDDHEAVTPANVVWGRVKAGAILLDAR